MSDIVQRLRFGGNHKSEATRHEAADRIEALEALLRLAEEVLSRAPYSTEIWPNGMHPHIGITMIRDAIAPDRGK